MHASVQVPIGSRVQLLTQDFDRCQREQREALRSIVTHLGPAANHDPAQFGLLGYSCAQLQQDEAQMVEEIWPQVRDVIGKWMVQCVRRGVKMASGWCSVHGRKEPQAANAHGKFLTSGTFFSRSTTWLTGNTLNSTHHSGGICAVGICGPQAVCDCDLLAVSVTVNVLHCQVPFAGCRVQGEFAGPAFAPAESAEEGPVVIPPAKLHAFSASMGFICHQDVLQQQQQEQR